MRKRNKKIKVKIEILIVARLLLLREQDHLMAC